MAELGFRTINEMVGQVDRLDVRNLDDHWKYAKIDLSPVLYKEPMSLDTALFKQEEQDHDISHVLDRKLIAHAKSALEKSEAVTGSFPITNQNRAVGTMLSNEISKLYLGEGLPKNTIHYKFNGSAGQSFGAFAAPGITFELEGEANDYFGKGLSGAQLILYPDKKINYDPTQNIIVGNVAFYGATAGESYIRGLAGERFAVRNSGVKVVVEGVGDHGCEYMTGGTVIILGETGRNFAAGMSGGVAFVYDGQKTFPKNCNMEMVMLDTLEEEDELELETLIRNHVQFTGSDLGQKILDNWSSSFRQFVKVMPMDYKAALEKRKLEAKKITVKI
jgi:glutamate synthase (NADPH/NADH) large chain